MMLLGIKKIKFEYWLPVLLCLVAGFLYANFVFGLPWRFNSPDEMANAFFAKRVAQNQTLAADAPLNNLVEGNIIHPRSMAAVAEKLVPRSFLGLPLIYGLLGKLFSVGLLPYFTAIFGFIGLLALYWFTRETMSRESGIFVILTTALLPAFWYYHSRAFFHNALFLDLFILNLLVSWLLIKHSHWWLYLLAGFLVGLGLSVRTAELTWLAGGILLWLILNHKAVKFKYIWLSVVGGVVAFIPVLMMNNEIYGSYLSVGYRPETGLISSDVNVIFNLIKEIILPFGFNLVNIWQNFQNYIVGLQWWWSLLALIGLVHFTAHWRNKSLVVKSYFWTGLVATIWLLVAYGSWSFHDNPDPGAITIGTAYARYFMPIYIFGLWLASDFLAWLWHKQKTGSLIVMVVGIYALLSWWLTMYASDDSLSFIRKNIIRFEDTGQMVQQLTDDNSVIVTGITDKFFFPERSIIVELTAEQDYKSVASLLQHNIPVYNFHTTFTVSDLKNKELPKLETYNLSLVPIKMSLGEHSLYKYILLKP